MIIEQIKRRKALLQSFVLDQYARYNYNKRPRLKANIRCYAYAIYKTEQKANSYH